MERDRMMMQRDFYEGIRVLDDKDRLAAYDALFAYGFDDVDPATARTKAAQSCVKLCRKRVDKSNEQFDSRRSAGEKGGNAKAANAAKKAKKPSTDEQPSSKPVANASNDVAPAKQNLPEGEGEGEGEVKNKRAPKKADPLDDQARDLVAYLNEKTGRGFRCTAGNLKEIKRTLRERDGQGAPLYSVEDCRAVIDIKCAEWLGDPEREKNLNPVTLFRASNFDRYLNQKPSSRAAPIPPPLDYGYDANIRPLP